MSNQYTRPAGNYFSWYFKFIFLSFDCQSNTYWRKRKQYRSILSSTLNALNSIPQSANTWLIYIRTVQYSSFLWATLNNKEESGVPLARHPWKSCFLKATERLGVVCGLQMRKASCPCTITIRLLSCLDNATAGGTNPSEVRKNIHLFSSGILLGKLGPNFAHKKITLLISFEILILE